MNEVADPIMLSSRQHWSYCPRQCALIHVELRGQVIDTVMTIRAILDSDKLPPPANDAQQEILAEEYLPAADYLSLCNAA